MSLPRIDTGFPWGGFGINQWPNFGQHIKRPIPAGFHVEDPIHPVGQPTFARLIGPPEPWSIKLWDKLSEAGLDGKGIADRGFTVMARYERLPAQEAIPGKRILFSLGFDDGTGPVGSHEPGFVALGVEFRQNEPPRLFLRRPDYDAFDHGGARWSFDRYYDIPLWDPLWPPLVSQAGQPAQTVSIALRFQQDGKVRVDGFFNLNPVSAAASQAFSTLQDLGWPGSLRDAADWRPFSARTLWLGDPDWAGGEPTATASGLSRLELFGRELTSGEVAAIAAQDLLALAPAAMTNSFVFLPCNSGRPFAANAGPLPLPPVKLPACPNYGFAFADKETLQSFPQTLIGTSDRHVLSLEPNGPGRCDYRIVTGGRFDEHAVFTLDDLKGMTPPFRSGRLITKAGCVLSAHPDGILYLDEERNSGAAQLWAVQRVAKPDLHWDIFNYATGNALAYDPDRSQIRLIALPAITHFGFVQLFSP